MTRKEYRSKCKGLKKEVNKLIDNRIEKLLNSGAFDLKKTENNYLLPKAVIYAIGNEIQFQFKPHDYEAIKMAENLCNFV